MTFSPKRAARFLAPLLTAGLVMGLAWPMPATSQARSGADSQLLRARDRFDYGDYTDAVRIIRRLLDEGRLVSGPQLVEAYRLLGVSLHYRGDEDESRAAFVRLLSVEPDFRLDPFFHPPKLVELFDDVRAENEALLAPLREQRRALEEQQRREEDARRRLLEEDERRRTVRQRRDASDFDLVLERDVASPSYIVNWLPFGAGQFQNDHHAKGIALATAQVVAGLASVIGYSFVAAGPRCQEVIIPVGSPNEPARTELRCGIPPDSLSLARNMERMKWTSGAAFWALIAYGIVDAHIHYQPRRVLSERMLRRETEPPPLPTDSAEEPASGSPSLSSAPPLDGPLPKTLAPAISAWLTGEGAGAMLTISF